MNRSERGAVLQSQPEGGLLVHDAAKLIQQAVDQAHLRSTLYRDCLGVAEATFPTLTSQKQSEIGALWYRHATLTQPTFTDHESSDNHTAAAASLEALVAAHLDALQTEWTLDLCLEPDVRNLRNWIFFERPFLSIYGRYSYPLERISEFTVDARLLAVYRQAGRVSEALAMNAMVKQHQHHKFSEYAAVVAGSETRWALGQPYLHQHGLYMANPWTPIIDIYKYYPDHIPLGPKCWHQWSLIRQPVAYMFKNGYFLIYAPDQSDGDMDES